MRGSKVDLIRHFYFEANRLDVGNLLFAQCESYLKQFSNQHAVYHIFGMSCIAHHGKLHESLAHETQIAGDRLRRK